LRSGHRAHAFLLLTADLVFPFLSGSFLFLSIRAASERAGIPLRSGSALAAYGFMATCCDRYENLSVLILMRNYPGQSAGVAKLTSIFTVTKFLSSAVRVILLAALGIYIFFRLRIGNVGGDA